MTRLLAIGLCAAAAGCGGNKDDRPAAKPAPEAAPADPRPANAGISWLEDDYAGALASARREGKPLVIDMWAEWCHTCLSMQHYVLTDKAFDPIADRFVWVSIDTEKEANAPVLARYPIEFWPTFFVISPADESVQARFVGAATVAQFREFLTQGERGHLDAIAQGGGLADDDPMRLARDGDRAALAGDHAAADAAYGAALAKAPADWPRRPDVLVAQIAARYHSEQWEACVELGNSVWMETGHAASAADFLYYAGECAEHLPAKDPRRAEILARGVKRLDRLVHDRNAPLSIDDRSDAMRIERVLLERSGDREGAKHLAHEQRALLDEAAAAAPNAHAASTYNWPRAEVYVYLGIGAELVDDLEASEKGIPQSYDPPYRLAWVLHRIDRNDDALAAANRALEKGYGPRKARVLMLIAEIQAARGDRDGEIAARRQVVEVYESLPDGQKQPGSLARAREALAALEE